MGSVTKQFMPTLGSAIKINHAYTPSDLTTQSVMVFSTALH